MRPSAADRCAHSGRGHPRLADRQHAARSRLLASGRASRPGSRIALGVPRCLPSVLDEGYTAPISKAALEAVCPTLLVAGEREHARVSNAGLAALMPHATSRFVPGLGHAWFIQRRELHVRMVEAWLRDEALPVGLKLNRRLRRPSTESSAGCEDGEPMRTIGLVGNPASRRRGPAPRSWRPSATSWPCARNRHWQGRPHGPDPEVTEMRVLVAGAGGLVGSAVADHLASEGHEVARLVRHAPGPGEVRWDPDGGTMMPRVSKASTP